MFAISVASMGIMAWCNGDKGAKPGVKKSRGKLIKATCHASTSAFALIVSSWFFYLPYAIKRSKHSIFRFRSGQGPFSLSPPFLHMSPCKTRYRLWNKMQHNVLKNVLPANR